MGAAVAALGVGTGAAGAGAADPAMKLNPLKDEVTTEAAAGEESRSLVEAGKTLFFGC